MRMCALRTVKVQYLFMAEMGSVGLVKSYFFGPQNQR